MSNIYHTEPPTYGKVLLHTSFGDIDVELWSKECPKACRNFLQLCMEGYYDNTIFHRIIRKFMVQGGDPGGTGMSGESIYGKPFRDEIHTRIKFNHRGQVAMANENSPNTNHSQFFFTLDSAPHLDKKHTIFGKITGNTIFNALRMGDVDTDKDDRPLDPPRLVSVEVLLNPFDDIIPRNLSRGGKGATDAGVGAAAAEAEKDAEQKKRKKGKRDLKLLSFGDEAEEDERELDSRPNGRGVKSAHDALDDKKFSKDTAYDLPSSARAGPRTEGSARSNGVPADEGLRKAIKSATKSATSTKTGRTSGSSRDAGEQSRGTGARSPTDGQDGNEADVEKDEAGGDGVEEAPRNPDDGEAFMQKMRRKMLDKKEALEKASKGNRERREDRRSRADDDRDQLDFEGEEGSQHGDGGQEGGGGSGSGGEEEDDTEKEKARRKAIKERAKEYESLRTELKAKHRAARIMTGEERAKYDAEHSHREMLSPLEQMRAKYKKRRKEAGTREDATMAKLASFASTVRASKTRADEDTEELKPTEAYHGQVTEGKLYEGEDDADDAEDWFTGPLKFKRHIDDDLRGSDGRMADDYAVIDPMKQKPGSDEVGSRSRAKPSPRGGGKETVGRATKGWAEEDRGNRRGGNRVGGSERGMGNKEAFSREGRRVGGSERGMGNKEAFSREGRRVGGSERGMGNKEAFSREGRRVGGSERGMGNKEAFSRGGNRVGGSERGMGNKEAFSREGKRVGGSERGMGNKEAFSRGGKGGKGGKEDDRRRR